MYTQSIAMAMHPDNEASLNNLRSLVKMILMECLIRRVTPEFFSDMVDDTNDFLCSIARIEAAMHVQNALKAAEPDRDPEVMGKAVSELLTTIMHLRTKLSEKTMQMAACRDDGETVS